MQDDNPNSTDWTDEEIEHERQRTIAKLTETETLEELMLRYQNPYGAREALHTAHIFNENVDQYLTEHPIVALDPTAHRLAFLAAALLADLYQRIGVIEYEMEEESARAK